MNWEKVRVVIRRKTTGKIVAELTYDGPIGPRKLPHYIGWSLQGDRYSTKIDPEAGSIILYDGDGTKHEFSLASLPAEFREILYDPLTVDIEKA